MIIHTYLTDGMLEWGKIFLDSFKYHHGEEFRIIIDTRNLNKKQIKELKEKYSNLEIKNKQLDLNEIAKKIGIDKSTLKRHKKEVEHSRLNKESRFWKLYVSVEDRYRNTIWEVMKENLDEDYLIHFDIDMYFRQRLDELFELTRKSDIAINFRESEYWNRQVKGNIIGFRICNKVFEFMERWREYIDEVPLHNKQKGHGQLSFYYAYLDFKDYLNWGDLPDFPKAKDDKAIIWTANRGTKQEGLDRSRKDFYDAGKE